MHDEDVDYVTVNPTVDRHKFNVVVMHYDKVEGQHVVKQCSQPLSEIAARALARAWAAAVKLEIR